MTLIPARTLAMPILAALALGACRQDTAPTPPVATDAPAIGEQTAPDSDSPFSQIESSAPAMPVGADTFPQKTIVADQRPPAPAWLADLAAQQAQSAATLRVDHDFQFTDRLPESGITFAHHIVPDGATAFKPNHYDHGNGIAVADVDGDGLYDIYFVSLLGRNELWRNKGDGTFELMADAGVDFEDRVGVTASFADLDNSGAPDLFVTSVRFGNALFKNDGTGKFTDITAQAGLEYEGHSSGAVIFDFNRDGLLDILVLNVGKYTSDEVIETPGDPFRPDPNATYLCYVGTDDAFQAHVDPQRAERSILYQNMGNMTFVDVTEKVGLLDESWSGDATPIDVNADGWPDLYIMNMQGHDTYYENVGGAGFIDKTAQYFPNTPWGSMGVKVFDYNNNGLLDLFITDMHSDMNEDTIPARDKMKARLQWPEWLTQSEGRSIWGNAFYERQADGTYVEVSDAIGAENYWPWGPSVGDLNANGYDDVFIASSMNFFYRYTPNTVLLNDMGERFVDSEFTLGVEPRRDGLAYQPWFTLDCGGEDWAHNTCVELGRQDQVDAWQPMGSRSAVIFDLDGDGDLDIVTNEWQNVPQVLVSDLAQRRTVNYLAIKLVGSQSNRDGLGALVTVEVADRSLLKVHDGRSGYLTQSSLPLYFGLGDAVSADRVSIVWPSGTEQVVPGPLSGSVTIEEPTN